MSDEEKPPETQEVQEIKLVEGKYPNGHTFSTDMLDRWVAIPDSEPIAIGLLTRADIDHLLFSTASIVRGVGELREALIAFSNGRSGDADTHLLNTMTYIIDGETHTRLLFEAIVKSVIKERKNGSE